MDDNEHSSLQPSDSDSLPVLRTASAGFARNLATALSGMLRSRVEVQLGEIQKLTGREFLLRADSPTYLSVLHAESSDERFLLEINLSILFPIIDRLLGGGREPGPPLRRPLTEIEHRLAGRLTTVLLDELRHAWKDLLDLRITPERTESNPRTAPLSSTSVAMTLLQFEVSFGGAHGRLSLGIPASVLNHIGEETSASRPSAAEDNRVPVIAQLAETKISAAELETLSVGDVITTEHQIDEPVIVRIDGAPHFLARSGVCSGRKAIRIERPIMPENARG